MIYKRPSGTDPKVRFFKIFFFAEVLIFVGTGLWWRKLCQDQGFRYTTHKTLPLALNFHYFILDKFYENGSSRDQDYKDWGLKTDA
jgi:hypothetical protein